MILTEEKWRYEIRGDFYCCGCIDIHELQDFGLFTVSFLQSALLFSLSQLLTTFLFAITLDPEQHFMLNIKTE